MTIYILLFIVFLFFAVFYNGNVRNNKERKVFYFLCLALALVGGFRYRIGIDTIRYMYAFEDIPKIFEFSAYSLESISQPIWFLINSLSKTIFDDFVVVQIFHALIVNLLIGRFIIKTCNKPFWALFIYFCLYWSYFNFEIMRESLCVALYLNIFLIYMNTQNIKQFTLYSIPIMFIHWFAFVPILITIVSHFVSKQWFVLISISSAIFLYFFVDASSTNLMLEYINFFMGDSARAERLEMYLESDSVGFISVSMLGLLLIILTQVIPSLIIASNRSINPSVAKMLIIYACVVLIRVKLLVVSRFLNYWDIIIIVYLINEITTSKHIAKIYLQCILVYLVVDGIHSFYTPTTDDTAKYDSRYIPYSSYFTKDLNPQRESLYMYKGL